MLLNGRLETDLHVKVTDKHQYLLRSSRHPSHTKQSIPFSTALQREAHLFSNNKQRHIRHYITCCSSNLVYMIQCNICKVQHIGKTKHHHSDRFGEHRCAITIYFSSGDMAKISTDAPSKKPLQNNTLINQLPFQITLPFLPILWTT